VKGEKGKVKCKGGRGKGEKEGIGEKGSGELNLVSKETYYN